MISTKKKLLYIFIANLIFTVHLVLVLIVSVGWLIPGFYYLFLGALVATFLSELFLGYCPLTFFEFGLRR